MLEENENIVIVENKENNIRYLQFKKLLEFGVNHAYCLRGENIDFSTGSEYENNSFDRLIKSLKLENSYIIKPKQSHTTNVLCINDEIPEESELIDVDSTITNKPGIALTTKNADCVLVLVYDPIKKVIANIHSGWKGTFKKVAEVTIKKMIDDYECDPKDIYCFICPCIRKCHFEVNEEVEKICEEELKYTGKLDTFITRKLEITEEPTYTIDLVKINCIVLEDLGVKKSNIIDCNICSVCHSDEVMSARADGKNFRRATAIIAM